MKEKLFSGILLLFFILLTEGLFRIWFSINFNTSFIFPNQAHLDYYPSLVEINKTDINKDDDYIDILILGASVMERVRGDVEGKLTDYFKQQYPHLADNIRIHNASIPAHSSRDSKEKMELLKDKAFDLVIFYHSINELRANNYPDDILKPDYSHLKWYQNLNLIKAHDELSISVIPFCVDYIYTMFQGIVQNKRLLGREEIRKDWIQMGEDIKTVDSYRDNIESIISITKSLESSLLLVEYVYYIPSNYDKKGIHILYSKTKIMPPVPIELWGVPKHVKKGIDLQNEVIVQISNQYKTSKVYSFAMNDLISKEKKNFNDICHFTDSGAQEFVNYLSPVIADILELK